MKEYFLGIDLGTTACKALVIDSSARELSFASIEYPVKQPAPNWQEQDLEKVWQGMILAVQKALQGINKEYLVAIGFSSQMHGFMLIDKNNKPLSPMLTWADGRAKIQAEKLKQRLNEKQIYLRTGCPLTALYYPARILWFKENRPKLFSKTAKFVSIKDAILFRLTGRWVVDKSQASSNGLLNIHQLEWDKPLFSVLGIESEKFPELVEPEEEIGELKPRARKILGLPQRVVLVAGAGDGGLANLGSGAIVPELGAVTIGTSAAARKVIRTPWLHPQRSTWLYYLAQKHWYLGGAINSGGAVLRWLRDSLFSDLRDQALQRNQESYTEIIKRARSISAGAEGLMFLPYLFGERTPYWNPDARGVFFGIAPHHTKAHFARAVLEGITMAMAQLVNLLKSAPGGIQELRASGGFVKSDFWLKLLADMTGCLVAVPRTEQGSALGAALLAMLGTGRLNSLPAVRDFIPVVKNFEPDLKLTKFYQAQLERFQELYYHLEQDFSRLARTNFPEAKRTK